MTQQKNFLFSVDSSWKCSEGTFLKDVCQAGQILAGGRIVDETDSHFASFDSSYHEGKSQNRTDIENFKNEPHFLMVFEAHKCSATHINDGQWLLSLKVFQ